MQLVNKYCYNIGVGRAQTLIALDCIIRTAKFGMLMINDTYLMGTNDTIRYSLKQLREWFIKKVPDICHVERICMDTLLQCSQFEGIWSILFPIEEQCNGLEDLSFIDMPIVMGSSVMSTLNNSKMHSLAELDFSGNFDWWESNTLF